jgi:hypothetical protein
VSSAIIGSQLAIRVDLSGPEQADVIARSRDIRDGHPQSDALSSRYLSTLAASWLLASAPTL